MGITGSDWSFGCWVKFPELADDLYIIGSGTAVLNQSLYLGLKDFFSRCNFLMLASESIT